MTGIATHQIAILGAIGKGFKSIDDLDQHLPINRNSISKAACKLVRKSLIERGEAGQFLLTEDGRELLVTGKTIKSGPNKPHQHLRISLKSTFRQRAWNAMRLQRRFTIPGICLIARKADDGNVEHNLHNYVRKLIEAEYVVTLPTREKGASITSNGFKVYRLIKDTGHLAPALTKGKIVDRNQLAEGCNDNNVPAT